MGLGGLGGMAGGSPSTAVADIEKAEECFRAVVAESPVPEMARFAETMLVVAEALSSLLGGFGGGPFGFDLGKMAQAVSTLQGLQQSGGGLGAGLGGGPGTPNGIAVGDVAGRFRPALRADQPRTTTGGGELRRRSGAGKGACGLGRLFQQVLPAAPPTADVAALREGVRSLLPDGIDLFASVIALLQEPDPPEHLDELVALASTVVSVGEAPSGLDQLVLAAALYARGLRDDGGWGDDGDGATTARTSPRRATSSPLR